MELEGLAVDNVNQNQYTKLAIWKLNFPSEIITIDEFKLLKDTLETKSYGTLYINHSIGMAFINCTSREAAQQVANKIGHFDPQLIITNAANDQTFEFAAFFPNIGDTINDANFILNKLKNCNKFLNSIVIWTAEINEVNINGQLVSLVVDGRGAFQITESNYILRYGLATIHLQFVG